MNPAPPFNFSWGSSSGVNGDTTSGPAADYFFSSPFAVGSGASATAEQSSSGKASPWLIIGGVLVGALFLVIALFRRS